MLRKLTLIAALIAATVLIAGTMTASSDAATVGYYTDGPYIATGFGEDVAEAEQDAIDQMNQIMAGLTLPPGHEIVGEIIVNEFADPPNSYVIEFKVLIWDGTGPKPPGIR